MELSPRPFDEAEFPTGTPRRAVIPLAPFQNIQSTEFLRIRMRSQSRRTFDFCFEHKMMVTKAKNRLESGSDAGDNSLTSDDYYDTCLEKNYF